MKLYINKLASIFSDIKNRKLKALLLYGPNESLAYNIFNRLKKYLQLEVKSLTGADAIKAASLKIILSTTNLFGSLELIKITEVGTSFEPIATSILAENINNFIVIIAKELSPSSSLRKSFESSDQIGALACYEEDKPSLHQFITSYLTSIQKTIEAPAVDYLLNNFSNREILLNELNKLSTYIGTSNQITLQDATMVSFGLSIDEIDLLCLDLIKGQANDYFTRLSKFDFTILAPIMAIRSFIRVYKNLYYLLAEKQEGKPMQETAQHLKAPIFFKFLPIFLKAAENQSLKTTVKGLALLNELEKNIKFSSIDPTKLFEEIFFSIHEESIGG